jgi:esterase/lipase
MKNFILPLMLGLLVLVYFLGPQTKQFDADDKLPNLDINIEEAIKFVSYKEKQASIKSGNESYFLFADSVPKKKPISVLYLHGFAASPFEGDPVHKWFAKQYDLNLYVPRLAHHGIIGGNAMLDLTANSLWESAKEAYLIAKTLGDSVIIIGTSTGCTLALMLAARYPEIKGLVLLSPNIKIKDPAAFVLNNPWGLNIARLIIGSDSLTFQNEPEFGKYWYNSYRLESTAQLQELLEKNMTIETFAKVNKPTLTLYYFKDKDHCDQMVNTDKIVWMHQNLGTSQNAKRLVNLPEAGDHILGNPIRSKDIAGVQREMLTFSQEILAMEFVKEKMF